MAQSKHEYFHKGADNQRVADIVVNLRRPSQEKIAKWSEAEKGDLPDFIETCERVFRAFIFELKSHVNAKQKITKDGK